MSNKEAISIVDTMKLALEALQRIESWVGLVGVELDAVKALEEALAKQEGQSNFCPQCEALARKLKAAKQEQGEPVIYGGHTASEMASAILASSQPKQEQLGEPVAWKFYLDGCSQVVLDEDSDPVIRHNGMPLYTTPQQHKPLTMFDTEKLAKQCGVEWTTRIDKLCRLAAAHGIKE